MAVNRASNVGTGRQVFKQLTGTNLEFRTLTPSTGVSLTQNANDITAQVDQSYSFSMTGQNGFLYNTAEAPNPPDASPLDKFAALVSRTAQSGGASTVQSALLVKGQTVAGTQSFEWLQLNFLDDYAASGENVAYYAKAYKNSTAPIWGAVFEVKNNGTDNASSMYGVEISIQSNGTSSAGKHIGCAIFFGGKTAVASEQEAGVLVGPLSGHDTTATLRYGYVAQGKCTESFATAATGTKGYACYGTFSTAAFDASGASNTPVGIKFGAGQRTYYTSGVGNGSNQTWFPGAFTPTIVGAIEMLVDGTKLYIPVCSNHP